MYEQYSVYWVDLNPTKGGEMNKVCPCVILSQTEVNKHLMTVIAAPVTSADLGLPMHCAIKVKTVAGFVVLEHMRALDKSRFGNKFGRLSDEEIGVLKETIKEYLVD